MADETANGTAGTANPPAQQFVLQKIYVKDSSFEAPNAPAVFQEEGAPQLQLNLAQKIGTLSENVYEVVLTTTLTCTLNGKTAYLAEVSQAGIFGAAGFDQANLEAILATYCPNVLFPYARQGGERPDRQRRFPALLPAADQLRPALRRTDASSRAG
jgi:preprotein translocase subunit SecB